MALNLREMSLPMQAVVFALLAVVLIGVGLYAPLSFSPIYSTKSQLSQAKSQVESLRGEVARLQQRERRAGELRGEIDALEREISNLSNIVPEDKQTDDFIRTLHSEASASSVAIRRLTAKQVVPKESYTEMPFELEVDGAYYNILEFFARLGRVSRIINVGDLNFTGIADSKSRKFQARPGTTVSGTFIATTFFTKGAEAAPPPKAGQPGAAGAPKK
jgi:type IV pilus assembly protein PilO